MWIREDLNVLFYYQESGLEVGGKLTVIDILFILKIQSPQQSTMMQQNGHYNAVTIDATFGTNENEVSFLFVNLIRVSKPKNPLET
jgi:hypothetical protein